MNIIEKGKKVPISEIKQGECFRTSSSSNILMRLENEYHAPYNRYISAVCLNDGTVRNFQENDKVETVAVSLIVN